MRLLSALRCLVFVIALFLLLAMARNAHAFCGFYVSGADAKLFANASQVVLMREGMRTVLSMQNDLTRLHARYTRDALGEDLVFKEAPAIVGGREVRQGAGSELENGATVVADKSRGANTFQGRYAVRHPWTGPIACAQPIRNVWGGPPNGLDNGGAKPAVGLAYAPRRNVQLASFLRSDVGALDVKAAGVVPSGVGTFAGPAAPETKKTGCLGCTMAASDGGGPALSVGAFALAAVLARRRRRPRPES